MLQDCAGALGDPDKVDWRLIALSVAAAAGWAGFAIQTALLCRARRQDMAAWNADFIAYRRDHLKPFAEQLRTAYDRYNRNQRGTPLTWEDAVHAANWPRGLPLSTGETLQSWWLKYGRGLDREDDFLLQFCGAIYPAFNELDKRPIRERSILEPNDFDSFDRARAGVADYFDRYSKMATASRPCRRFLEKDVRPNHYYKLKLSAYLDLVLVRCWGPTSETASGKQDMFALGREWSSDDPRRPS
jgi:hypothetical protein